MADRVQYRVLPHPTAEGDWVITKDGREIVEDHDKEHAVEIAVDLARGVWEENGVESQLLIHGNDGRIQEERTYGNDPNPPVG
jgi:Uncharacterized protein conserved in bacteria (DUF2188)